jgi:predicted TPR repeat methyltransferase
VTDLRSERAARLGSRVREAVLRLRVLDPRCWVPARARVRPADPEDWDEFYETSVDPYGYRTSARQRRRYERTLEALQGRRFARALEVGCSEGVLTEMLAPHCEELLAVDVSEVAVRRARQRVAGLTGVAVERRTLPEELPAGPFDLILCSDVLYYWGTERLLAGLRAFERALAPGGWLLAIHERHDTTTHTMSGERLHRLLARNTSLRHDWRRTEWVHRFDRFERPAEL